jgi:hypothetical protein
MTKSQYVEAALCALGLLLFGWLKAAGVIIDVLWLAPIIISIELGVTRHRSGWMWGLFLGWLGVLILAIMRPVQRSVNV